MGKKVVTLGEIMLRLSTPGNTRFVQSDSFDVVYGGGEANVAVSCANYGHDAYFVTKLPKHEIGQSAVNALRKYGVKTDFIARGGDRVGNEEDAELCLGFKPDADVEGGKTDAEGYKGIFKAMAKEFGFKYVISTLRESFSATHNGWKAMIYNGEEFYESKRYDINPIIDRVGGGDSFSGGIIHGLLTKPNQGAALEFAVAASALKHTINGDFNLVSVEEVEALAGGDASGRVQR